MARKRKRVTRKMILFLTMCKMVLEKGKNTFDDLTQIVAMYYNIINEQVDIYGKKPAGDIEDYLILDRAKETFGFRPDVNINKILKEYNYGK